MTDLSPAALAVRRAAIYAGPELEGRIAAALRAAADQVVPHPGRYPMNEYMEGLQDCKQDFRAALLAIADELEAQP